MHAAVQSKPDNGLIDALPTFGSSAQQVAEAVTDPHLVSQRLRSAWPSLSRAGGGDWVGWGILPDLATVVAGWDWSNLLWVQRVLEMAQRHWVTLGDIGLGSVPLSLGLRGESLTYGCKEKE